MNLIKNIFWVVLMNIAVILIINLIIFILEYYFGIKIWGGGYTGLFIFSALVGFVGAFISLALSKWSVGEAADLRPIGVYELARPD